MCDTSNRYARDVMDSWTIGSHTVKMCLFVKPDEQSEVCFSLPWREKVHGNDLFYAQPDENRARFLFVSCLLLIFASWAL